VPENTTFNAPDTTKINWWYVGGGILGVSVLIFLLNKKPTNSQTVAAGTSINAALGSIQEQELQQQGALSFAQSSIDTLQSSQNTAFGNLNDVISTGFTGVNEGISEVDQNIATGNSGLTDLINNDINGINQQLGSILGQEATTYSYLQNTRQVMEQALGANNSQVSAIDAEIQSVFNEMESGFKQLADELQKPVAVQSPPSSGGSSGPVHNYTVYLPGGGAIHTNASSAAAALNNVPGGHF